MLTDIEIKELEDLSKENRQNVIKMVYNAKSGHIGGSLSSCEIMTVLFHKCMKHALGGKNTSDYEIRDRFVLSKGHISPLYYSVLSQIGFIPKDELMTFRKFGSRLQGHPSLYCPGVEVATGSLGQGLSIACGKAISLKLDNNPAHVFVLLGDGELQEGSIWEAMMQAPHRKLNNLTAIIDRNRLQIDGCTESVKALDNLQEKIYLALESSKSSDKPTAIIANTTKGKGVSFMENNAAWHGKAPSQEDYEKAMMELK